MKEKNRKELFRLAKVDKELEKMAKNIVKLNMDTKYVSLYDENRLDKLARDFERAEIREESIAEGLSQGLEQGIEQGTYQNKIEIAKKMLSKKMDINDIAEITELTKEEIEKLNTLVQ